MKTLDLRENSIGDEGAVAIADALRVNKVLKSLYLSINQIGNEGAKALASALRVAVLTNLDLSSNEICGLDSSSGYPPKGTYLAAGITALAEALKVNGVLKTLDIGDNNIGDEGAAAIAEALCGNGVLTTLDLSYNRIGDEGAKALASVASICLESGMP